MKIHVNLLHNHRWSVHCIAEDCKTPVGSFVKVESLDVMRRLLRASGATNDEMADFEKHLKGKSHGNCWIGNLKR